MRWFIWSPFVYDCVLYIPSLMNPGKWAFWYLLSSIMCYRHWVIYVNVSFRLLPALPHFDLWWYIFTLSALSSALFDTFHCPVNSSPHDFFFYAITTPSALLPLHRPIIPRRAHYLNTILVVIFLAYFFAFQDYDGSLALCHRIHQFGRSWSTPKRAFSTTSRPKGD